MLQQSMSAFHANFGSRLKYNINLPYFHSTIVFFFHCHLSETETNVTFIFSVSN